MEFKEVARFVSERWKFNQKNYPDMPSENARQRHFCLRHVALHQSKAAGNMVSAIEPMDHGKPLDRALLTKGIRNSIINTLMLAELAGVLPSEIERMVRAWGLEQHQL